MDPMTDTTISKLITNRKNIVDWTISDQRVVQNITRLYSIRFKSSIKFLNINLKYSLVTNSLSTVHLVMSNELTQHACLERYQWQWCNQVQRVSISDPCVPQNTCP